MRAYKPYNYNKLKRFTQVEVKVLNAMLNLFSDIISTPFFLKGLASVLNFTPSVSFKRFEAINIEEIREPFFISIFELYSEGHKVFLEIELKLAFILIKKALRWEEVNIYQRRRLTPAEEGIMSYLLLKALSEIQEKVKIWRLYDIVSTKAELQRFLNNSKLFEFRWEVICGSDSGFSRLIVPDSILSARSLKKRTSLALKLLEHITTTVSIKGPKVSLSLVEIYGLKPGDIILFDKENINKTEDGLKGEVEIGILGTDRLRWKGEIEREEGGCLVKISGVLSKMEKEELNERFEEREEELLEDLPVTLQVELDRLEINVKELVDLNIGSVLVLNKKTEDLVDLRVKDRLVARGELVQVEDRLGLRILQKILK
jgi:type III secretion protein Q